MRPLTTLRPRRWSATPRRLFTPRIYTQAGLDWIDDNDMSSVLLRHFPGLLPVMRTTRNVFAPSSRVGDRDEIAAGAAVRLRSLVECL
jgi:hypothetical protein